MFETYPEVVTVPEVAEMLRVGRNTAYEIVRSGSIKSVKAGRTLRVARSAVVDYLTQKPVDMEHTAVAITRKKR